MTSEEKHKINEAVKLMLRDALEFDNYRKSLLENFWPQGIPDDEDFKELAYTNLEDYLNRMQSATKEILKPQLFVPDKPNDPPF